MSSGKKISRVRRKVFSRNIFLREVTYMFTIETLLVFESKFSEIVEFVKTYGFKTKQIGSEGAMGIMANKEGIDLVITSRLVMLRVSAEAYNNFDEFKGFLLSFVTNYVKEVLADSIDSMVIVKTNDFVLQRNNDILKKVSEEQYVKSLFSADFLSGYESKGVFKETRDVHVSSRYSVTSGEKELKVELAISGYELKMCKLEAIEDKLTNLNNAIYDMWSYTISANVKETLDGCQVE